MTANQIAYASVEETKRHNMATEGELNRHNVESEKISQEVNRINDKMNTITEFYQGEKNRIQEKYNDAYLELQKAQGTRKLDLQQELNLIEADRVRITENYNNELAAISREKNAIELRHQDELKRHNEIMEGLESFKSATSFLLETRRNEYMSTYYRDLISVQEEMNRIKSDEVNNNIFATNEKVFLEQVKVANETAESMAKTDLIRTQQQGQAIENWWINWDHGPGSLINSSLRMFKITK